MYLPYSEGSSNLLIYFHANAEDIGLTVNFLTRLKEFLSVDIIAIEYPGYGVYEGVSSEVSINKDALTVFDHITHVLKID